MSFKNIKQIRSELRVWGHFWRTRKYNMGGGGISLTALFIEKKRNEKVKEKRRLKYIGEGERHEGMLKGVDVSFDVIAKESRNTRLMTSADIRIPTFVQALDDIIESMKQQCQLALVAQYINEDEQVGYWIDEAEREIMSRL